MPDLLASLSSQRQDELTQLIKTSIVIDFLIPFVTTTLLPLKGDAINNALKHEQAQGSISLLINTITKSAPDIWKKALAGDVKGAMLDGVNSILTDGAVHEAVIAVCTVLLDFWGSSDDTGKKFKERGTSVVNILGGVDAILTGFDSYTQAYAFDHASIADTWNITVTPSKVSISPQIGDIGKGEEIKFKAAVPSLTGTNSPEVEYRWGTSGEHGEVTDKNYYTGGSTTHTGIQITTNSDVIDFVSDGSNIGEDSVYVEVYVKDGSARNLVGRASVPITIRDIKPSISPKLISMWPPDIQKFRAKVPESLVKDGDQMSYIWSTTGNNGKFVTGGSSYESELDIASWMVLNYAQDGTDEVSVEVMRNRDGKTVSLGIAKANILIDKDRRVLQGSWGVEQTEASDFEQNGRMCAYAYIYVPKVAGAIKL